jgi:DNA-(apurinic or apyrimidinic site) lyase
LELNELLSIVLNCKSSSKTVVFAVKMYGYAYTIISWNDVIYPMNINIPIDSRLKKIYNTCKNLDVSTGNEIMNYFWDLSKKYSIPPLDLDALLWLEYRKLMKK